MDKAKELLLLVHRIPYPPNKGDKIRSFNLLKHLAKSYRVHVGAFVDDAHDWRYQRDLETLCGEVGGEVRLLNLNPTTRKLKSLTALATGSSLTVPYYASPAMQGWVDGLLARRPIERVVVFSSPMAQFVSGPAYAALRRVIDFVDIDSDKWAQYARAKPWPLSWIYGREARTLFAFERKIADEFDASVFVTEDECALFRRLAPEVQARVNVAHNGVDTDYFSPQRDYPNPYPPAAKVLVFTGAMDYWANVDAVRWFAREIFPGIRARAEAAEFYIVGGRPTTEVQALGKLPGVTVTGAVQDIRPFMAHARAAVAPMRIARGVQNKVLEAMAMARPVLATPEAAEGIAARVGQDLWVESTPAGLQQQALQLLTGEAVELGSAARQCVLQGYGWATNLQRFSELLESTPPELENSLNDSAMQAVTS
ncbi:MAG: TIGR03087 family PEP-CTERM/XrtA system glycosyltransferase [Gammaproteobacteria bacterium]|nr:TIGR03087 family PEP-CTERM/XrtA system glycosyltransferase [Gammaproteobacteria bacterium]